MIFIPATNFVVAKVGIFENRGYLFFEEAEIVVEMG
jgi:hypothetical protein